MFTPKSRRVVIFDWHIKLAHSFPLKRLWKLDVNIWPFNKLIYEIEPCKWRSSVFKSGANVRTLKTQRVTWMELSSGLPYRIILTTMISCNRPVRIQTGDWDESAYSTFRVEVKPRIWRKWPITVAAMSKTWNAFAPSNTAIVGSNPARHKCLFSFILCLWCPM